MIYGEQKKVRAKLAGIAPVAIHISSAESDRMAHFRLDCAESLLLLLIYRGV